jgi:hypothetical protein
MGHVCVGIDYSPASIAYARGAAEAARLPIQYVLADIRTAKFDGPFDLVMMLWGEFNVFSPTDARHVLRKSASALSDADTLLLEVHTFDAIRRLGHQPSTVRSLESGLFSDRAHTCAEQHFWNSLRRAATTRYTITHRRDRQRKPVRGQLSGVHSKGLCGFASELQLLSCAEASVARRRTRRSEPGSDRSGSPPGRALGAIKKR